MTGTFAQISLVRRSRRLAACVACAALLVPLGTRPAAGQEAADSGPILRTVLENGLQVIVVENTAVPLATVLVAVRNGAFTQDSAEQGLAHLYEHLLFRSYAGGGDDAFRGAVGRLNGRYNGATSQEVVYYFVAVPSRNVDGAIKIVARLVRDAKFSKDDLRDERPVVLDELQRYQSDPEGQLGRQVEHHLWGASWSRKDVTGDSASLAGITLDRLKATYSRYYVPNNAALIVTGDVSPDRVVEQARHEFRDWKPGPDPFAGHPIPPIAPLTQSNAVVLAQSVLDVTIRIALQGPSADSDTAATYAADVLSDVFNDPSSAFQHRLVEGGLFQSVSVSYFTLNHTGPIEFVGKTTPERAEEALLALISELDNLDLLDGVTEEDLAIAKKRRQVGTVLALEHGATLAPQLAHWWATVGMDYYLGYTDRMGARTLDDLRRYARTYIVSRPRVIGVLAPPATVQTIAAWLRRGGRPEKR